MIKRIYFLALCMVMVCAGMLYADSCCVTATTDSDSCEDEFCKAPFIPRSQGISLARSYVGSNRFIHEFESNEDSFAWLFSMALEYYRNRNRDTLGSYFSFNKGCNSFIVGPDTTAGGTDTNIRNVDLGLSNTFKSRIMLNPKIQNFVIEPSFYVDLDYHLSGAWFDIRLPITWTQWKLDCCEEILEKGDATFAANFVRNTNDPVAVGATSALDAFAGKSTFGDKKKGLSVAKLFVAKNQKWGVADVTMNLGWNFVSKEDWHVAWYFRTIAPAGGEPEGAHIFEPRIGNGRWQVGGGFHGQALFWKLEDKDISVNGTFDIYATHLFARHVCRCFDLKDNGCASRYLLLKEFNVDGDYNNNLVNFADVFSVVVRSHFDWQMELLAAARIDYKAWSFDLGYNLWARARERFDCDKIRLCICGSDLDEKDYGIKGLSGAGGSSIGLVDPTSTIIMTSGMNVDADSNSNLLNQHNIFSKLDFDRSRAPRAISHTLFAYGQHMWKREDYSAFLGAGFDIEFGNGNKALDTWGLSIRAGIYYS